MTPQRYHASYPKLAFSFTRYPTPHLYQCSAISSLLELLQRYLTEKSMAKSVIITITTVISGSYNADTLQLS